MAYVDAPAPDRHSVGQSVAPWCRVAIRANAAAGSPDYAKFFLKGSITPDAIGNPRRSQLFD